MDLLGVQTGSRLASEKTFDRDLGLDVTADNGGAINCYKALGFVHEGTFRECWKRSDGKYVDCHFMAILKHEWLDLR